MAKPTIDEHGLLHVVEASSDQHGRQHAQLQNEARLSGKFMGSLGRRMETDVSIK